MLHEHFQCVCNTYAKFQCNKLTTLGGVDYIKEVLYFVRAEKKKLNLSYDNFCKNSLMAPLILHAYVQYVGSKSAKFQSNPLIIVRG